MSRNTITHANQSGSSYRNAVNNSFDTLASNFSGAGEASAPILGQFCVDTTATKLKIFDGTSFKVIGDYTQTNLGLSTSASPTFTGTTTMTGLVVASGTGSIQVPSGTTAQRPTAVLGQVRYNTQLSRFEGYQSVSGTAQWDTLTVGANVLDSGITTAKIADGAVTDAKLDQSFRVKGKAFWNTNFNLQTSNVTNSGQAYLSWDHSTVIGRGNQHPQAMGSSNCMFIDRNGVSYAWGNNRSGCLGTGIDQNVAYVKDPQRVNFRAPHWWRTFHLGGDGVMYRYTYTSDNGGYNQTQAAWMAPNSSDDDYFLGTMPPVRKIYHCFDRTYWLTENGMLFVAGASGASSHGNNRSAAAAHIPFQVQFYNQQGNLYGMQPKIVQFTSTHMNMQADHTDTANPAFYALSNLGYVYAWGDGTYGQMGSGTTNDQPKAQEMDITDFSSDGTDRVVYIHAGGGYSNQNVFAITESGKCFGWGTNANGELGIGNTTQQNSPQQLTSVATSPLNGKKVLHVITSGGTVANGYSYYNNTHFLTSDGNVYACGYSSNYGANMGISAANNTAITIPTLIVNNPKDQTPSWTPVALFKYGNCDTTTQYLICTRDAAQHNQIAFSFGNNANHQLGRGVTTTAPANQTEASSHAWQCAEIEFDSIGHAEVQASAGATIDDRVTGPITTTDFQPDWSLSTAAGGGSSMRNIGEPVAFFANFSGYAQTSRGYVCMLDKRGHLYFAGQMGTVTPHVPQPIEVDDSTEGFNNQHYLDRFTFWLNQPEKATSMVWLDDGQNNAENFAMIGSSGLVYVAGNLSAEQSGQGNAIAATCTPLAITTN